MNKNVVLGGLLMAFSTGFVGSVHAAGQHDSTGHHEPETKGHSHDDSQHAVPHWAKTLTKEQKADVDRMHHDLDSKLESIKADEALKQKELNLLTIKDDGDLSEINRKIDELMAVKNQILRARYAHLVEMRRALNAEQRESYDAAILKRSEIK